MAIPKIGGIKMPSTSYEAQKVTDKEVAAKDSFVVAKAKKPKKVIRLEAIKIEGRIQKPQAFYILQRANLGGLGNVDIKESFIPKILKSVDKAPF